MGRRVSGKIGLLVGATLALAPGCATQPKLPARLGGAPRRSPLRGAAPVGARGRGRPPAASGVVVASDPVRRLTWVLTAGHFVASPAPETIYVRTTGTRDRYRATLVRADRDPDLALVLVENLVLPPVKSREVAHLGDDVWVIAFPRGAR